MSSTSETGHAKNVAKFKLVVSYVKEMESEYNPVNPNITVAALTTKETAATNVMQEVTNALIPSKNAINERDEAFKPLAKIATRVINALAASGVSDSVLKDARGIVNKLTGKRTGKKPEPIPGEPEKDPTSVSQMSYDYKKANFDLLVALVKGQSAYAPNEVDLKVTALEALGTRIGNLNADVANTLTALNTKRNLRDKELYEPVFGISELTGTIKKYVKSVVGTSSPVYKRIAAIKIVKPGNLK